MRTISMIPAGKQRWRPFVLLTVLMVAVPDALAQFSIEKEPGVNPWTHLNFHNNPDNFQFAIVTDLTGRERRESSGTPSGNSTCFNRSSS